MVKKAYDLLAIKLNELKILMESKFLYFQYGKEKNVIIDLQINHYLM